MINIFNPCIPGFQIRKKIFWNLNCKLSGVTFYIMKFYISGDQRVKEENVNFYIKRSFELSVFLLKWLMQSVYWLTCMCPIKSRRKMASSTPRDQRAPFSGPCFILFGLAEHRAPFVINGCWRLENSPLATN